MAIRAALVEYVRRTERVLKTGIAYLKLTRTKMTAAVHVAGAAASVVALTVLVVLLSGALIPGWGALQQQEEIPVSNEISDKAEAPGHVSDGIDEAVTLSKKLPETETLPLTDTDNFNAADTGNTGSTGNTANTANTALTAINPQVYRNDAYGEEENTQDSKDNDTVQGADGSLQSESNAQDTGNEKTTESGTANSSGAGTARTSAETPGENEPKLPYLIYVSKNSHTIAILGLDDNGEHTVLLRTFHTAVGRTSSLTRAGTYKVTGRERWHKWSDTSYSPYATKYSGGVWFHGPLFSQKDPYTLRASSYNEIGTNATSGCMRTYTAAAMWIYNNCENGTTVIIANDSLYTSTPAAKLEESQNYDPTDPEVKENVPDMAEEILEKIIDELTQQPEQPPEEEQEHPIEGEQEQQELQEPPEQPPVGEQESQGHPEDP